MSNEIFSDTDTPDWNKLMDSYEQYVMSTFHSKKTAKGDMETLAVYAPQFI